MRAFSSGRVSVSIAVLVAVFVLGTMVISQNAVAREPQVEMYTNSDGGGMSGGGEWKTDPSGDSQGLPVNGGKVPDGGHRYTQGPQAGVQASEAERVEAWYIRLLRAVSNIFVKKYF